MQITITVSPTELLEVLSGINADNPYHGTQEAAYRSRDSHFGRYAGQCDAPCVQRQVRPLPTLLERRCKYGTR